MAGINIKYSAALNALVLKVGRRDAVNYRLLAQAEQAQSACLLEVHQEGDRTFYYSVGALKRLDALMALPLSLVQYRTLLESLRDVMELCVREGLPQGNICFDPSCVFVDERAALHVAFVPFERVDGTSSALELLEYISGRAVRMVLPQDKAVRDKVAAFARSRCVLPAADFNAFLTECFGAGAASEQLGACGSRLGSGMLAGSSSLGRTSTTAVDTHVMTEAERAQRPRTSGLLGAYASARDADAAHRPMALDPVAMMTGAAPRRHVAHGVATEVGGMVDSGPLAHVEGTTLLRPPEPPGDAVASEPPADEPPRTSVFVLERLRDHACYELPCAPVVIGRSATCDIAVAGNGALSRRHVRLDMAAGLIEDLGSANGTQVRGQRLAAHVPVPLAAGEEFILADEAFLVAMR